jgi:hypothetical protein
MLIRHKGLKNTWKANRRILSWHLHIMRSAPHEQRANYPRIDAAGYGQKNKPTTFRKSWLGLNISSRPLFMRSAPHVNCSDGKGRDKNLNVQGICEEFLKNCEELREKVLLPILLRRKICMLVLFLLPLHCQTKAL